MLIFISMFAIVTAVQAESLDVSVFHVAGKDCRDQNQEWNIVHMFWEIPVKSKVAGNFYKRYCIKEKYVQ